MSFKAEALRVFIASPSEAEKGAAPHRSFCIFWSVDKVRRQCFTKIDTIKLNVLPIVGS